MYVCACLSAYRYIILKSKDRTPNRMCMIFVNLIYVFIYKFATRN